MAFKPTSALIAALLMTAAPGVLLAQTADTATDSAATDATATDAATPAAADATTAPAADTATDATSTPPATAATETDAAAAAAMDTTPTDTTAPAADAATGTSAEGAATTPADATPADPATASDTPDPTATGDAASPAEAGASSTAGKPAATREEAKVGGYYVESTNAEWTLRCLRAPEGTDPCELYQLMQDDKGNPVAEISLIPLAGEAVAGATIVAPLETDLVAGLGLKVDAGKRMDYPFSFCAPIGCVARVGFSQAEVDAMKRGNKATVTLLPYGAEPSAKVDLDLSLTGFTAGYDALKAKGPANPSQQ